MPSLQCRCRSRRALAPGGALPARAGAPACGCRRVRRAPACLPSASVPAGTAVGPAQAAPTSSPSSRTLERAFVQELRALGAEGLKEPRERTPPPGRTHLACKIEVAGELEDRVAERRSLSGRNQDSGLPV